MIEKEHLKYFITEDIFLLKENKDLPEDKKEAPTEKKKLHDVVVWTHELTEKDQALLEKMMKAVNLGLEKVHLIHHEDEFTSQFKTMMSFGNVDFIAEKVDQEVLLNKPFQHESQNILVSYPISSFHDNDKRKAELWNGLKDLFKV